MVIRPIQYSSIRSGKEYVAIFGALRAQQDRLSLLIHLFRLISGLQNSHTRYSVVLY